MTVQAIDGQAFQAWVSRPGVVVVEFGAEWCPPCKALLPLFEELAAFYAGAAAFGKVDCDASPELASAFGVMSMPTVIVFKDEIGRAHV